MTIYCIIPVEDITNEMIDEAINSSDTLRYSLDGALAILKFDTPFPNSAKGHQKYSLEDILGVLQSEDWLLDG